MDLKKLIFPAITCLVGIGFLFWALNSPHVSSPSVVKILNLEKQTSLVGLKGCGSSLYLWNLETLADKSQVLLTIASVDLASDVVLRSLISETWLGSAHLYKTHHRCHSSPSLVILSQQLQDETIEYALHNLYLHNDSLSSELLFSLELLTNSSESDSNAWKSGIFKGGYFL